MTAASDRGRLARLSQTGALCDVSGDDRDRHRGRRALFVSHTGDKGIRAARSQYDVWLAIALCAQWANPEDVKATHPRASILKGSRVVFNVKGNDYRLVAAVQYRAGVLVIRFFGSHAEYDRIDAETV
jgi:mRNA interferase HigB